MLGENLPTSTYLWLRCSFQSQNIFTFNQEWRSLSPALFHSCCSFLPCFALACPLSSCHKAFKGCFKRHPACDLFPDVDKNHLWEFPLQFLASLATPRIFNLVPPESGIPPPPRTLHGLDPTAPAIAAPVAASRFPVEGGAGPRTAA